MSYPFLHYLRVQVLLFKINTFNLDTKRSNECIGFTMIIIYDCFRFLARNASVGYFVFIFQSVVAF